MHFHFSNNKHGGQRSGAVVAAAFCFTTLLLLVNISFAQNGGRIDELKQNISTREEEIKKLEQEIADYQQRIVVVGNQKASLQNAIKTLDLTRGKLGKDIKLTQTKIARTNDTIRALNGDINDKAAKIDKNKQLIANILQKIDQAESETLLEVLLANVSISAFFEEVEDLDRLQASIQDSIKTLERLKAELGTSKASHQDEQKKLVALNSQLGDQKEIADAKRAEQNALLTGTKNQESSYRQLLADREKRKAQFEREIEDFEAQLKAEIDPNSFPAPGTRVLASPLDSVFVTQRFGKTVDAKRLYVSGTHNGTDFRAAAGTRVKAALGGTVVGTGDTDRVCAGASYGKWVMVRHPNGLSTLYAHLDLIKVSEGQNVGVGDLLGYSGNTGYSTGPHLHFTVFVSSAVQITNLPSKSCKGAIFRIPVAPQNAYLDPQAYL